MEFLLVLALIFVIAIIMPKPDAIKKDLNGGALVVVKEKNCPPHQWFWQDMVDKDGNKVGERMMCKLCGPLSKSLNNGD